MCLEAFIFNGYSVAIFVNFVIFMVSFITIYDKKMRAIID